MVSKWVVITINGIHWGYNPLILTFDPNFQRDIQVILFTFVVSLLCVCDPSVETVRGFRHFCPLDSQLFFRTFFGSFFDGWKNVT